MDKTFDMPQYWSIEDIAKAYRYTRRHIFNLRKFSDFPTPVGSARNPRYSVPAVRKFMKELYRKESSIEREPANVPESNIRTIMDLSSK